jgi:oxygen-independent coproporphyrinogen III oxidase
MCNQYLSWSQAAGKYGITADALKGIVNYDESSLRGFKEDNLLTFDENEVWVSELGRFFIRNIAAAFDSGLNKSGKTFSKAL